MSDEISLADVIADAISDYYNDPENPVIVTGFLIATNVVEADGRPGISVTYPETQAYSQSLGLIAFADEYVRDDVRQAFNEIRDV